MDLRRLHANASPFADPLATEGMPRLPGYNPSGEWLQQSKPFAPAASAGGCQYGSIFLVCRLR